MMAENVHKYAKWSPNKFPDVVIKDHGLLKSELHLLGL